MGPRGGPGAGGRAAGGAGGRWVENGEFTKGGCLQGGAGGKCIQVPPLYSIIDLLVNHAGKKGPSSSAHLSSDLLLIRIALSHALFLAMGAGASSALNPEVEKSLSDASPEQLQTMFDSLTPELKAKLAAVTAAPEGSIGIHGSPLFG